MPRTLSVGIIGDFNPTHETHLATNIASRQAEAHLGIPVEAEWIPTPSLEEGAEETLGRFDALLCAPGSPNKSMKGALNGIRFARETGRPFLGTCGGFQHVVIEYARNVMAIADADHAEEHPGASCLVVTPLACSLWGKSGEVEIRPNSVAYQVYHAKTSERFYCSFGLNPAYRAEVENAGLRASGFDRAGDVRILELPGCQVLPGDALRAPGLVAGRKPPSRHLFARGGCN